MSCAGVALPAHRVCVCVFKSCRYWHTWFSRYWVVTPVEQLLEILCMPRQGQRFNLYLYKKGHRFHMQFVQWKCSFFPQCQPHVDKLGFMLINWGWMKTQVADRWLMIELSGILGPFHRSPPTLHLSAWPLTQVNIFGARNLGWIPSGRNNGSITWQTTKVERSFRKAGRRDGEASSRRSLGLRGISALTFRGSRMAAGISLGLRHQGYQIVEL